MQIVIDIPEENYNEIITEGMDGSHLTPLYEGLVNGIPLPKQPLTVRECNKRYYSASLIKGFECGAKRQFKADRGEG